MVLGDTEGVRSRGEARRARTIDEIVDTALAVMAEHGAAGLSLGEVAKRMGLRTPSLYVYFESKAALCDEIFARGWQDLLAASAPQLPLDSPSLAEDVERVIRTVVDWALRHPGHAQLMFWRPIAGWEPSPEAYAASGAVLAASVAALESAQDAGRLAAGADVAEMSHVLTILASGVISQQLSNEPGIPMARGTYAATLPRLAAMFVSAYGTAPEGAQHDQHPDDHARRRARARR
jgi:AcrR family transcriptional regulator